MDLELASLASAAATAMIQTLATSGGELVHTAIGDLWHRRHSDRAQTVLAELGEAGQEAAQAYAVGDQDTTRALIAEWTARLRRLLADDPGAADQLRLLLEELTGHSRQAPQGPTVTMNARASQHATIHQAAGNMHITGR
ncbi:hypothetical protein OG401_41260 [Kitasatospora purpeofusca]|uniref:hypothetical protein n=1 Tax=Kitasatospora purpeofusca TaxID=67352 RepID=UPI00224CD5F6|nr:hypothetical protein [Kitasatospora purpeofusca]MCX4690650.1 hypothetical protein [Kitasatospora purpeofusca]